MHGRSGLPVDGPSCSFWDDCDIYLPVSLFVADVASYLETLTLAFLVLTFVPLVDCLKITEDKSSENRVYTSDARLIIVTHDAEHEARASISVQYQDARVETRVPATL